VRRGQRLHRDAKGVLRMSGAQFHLAVSDCIMFLSARRQLRALSVEISGNARQVSGRITRWTVPACISAPHDSTVPRAMIAYRQLGPAQAADRGEPMHKASDTRVRLRLRIIGAQQVVGKQLM